MTLFVYFIQAGNESGPIKIGYSSDVEKRIASLRTGNPHPLRVLGTVEHENAADIERKLHAAFDELRLEGEWFSYDQRIISAISTLRETGLPPDIQDTNCVHSRSTTTTGLARGLWFHTRNESGEIVNQGQILRRIGEMWQVQLYDFVVGDASKRIVVRDEYFWGASFYATDDDMRDAYDREPSRGSIGDIRRCTAVFCEGAGLDSLGYSIVVECRCDLTRGHEGLHKSKDKYYGGGTWSGPSR